MKQKELFLKILKAEEKLNYTNSGVIGGFNNYFLDQLADVLTEKVKKGLIDYENLSRENKYILVKELRNFILNGKLEDKKNKILIFERPDNKDISLNDIPGIGKKRLKELHNLGIYNIKDLLYYFPRKYEDRKDIMNITSLENNMQANICGIITSVDMISPRPRLKIIRANIKDATGTITAIWFNQLYLKKHLQPGKKIYITGKTNFRFNRQIQVKDFEFFNKKSDLQNIGRIVPFYASNENLTQKFLRNTIKEGLKKGIVYLEETFPETLLKKMNLMPIREAVQEMHYPASWKKQKEARNRLAFEELLIFQLALRQTRQINSQTKGIVHTNKNGLNKKFLANLPFKLTNAQKKVIKHIKEDMESEKIMSRLVQGDVGSGKTVVAMWSLIKAISGGYQGALMAPTEILAEQHYLSIIEMVKPLGIETILLTGSMTKKEKNEKLKKIFSNEAKLIIGTHALIQSEVNFANLGLVVIDEQHRFGVKQRSELQNKGLNPDILVMTATPIPRSLALTFYGDLDLSIIDELPPGRQKIKTYHVTEKMEKNIYQLIYKEIKKGQQAYVVCPLIEESEKLDLDNATELAEHLQNDIYPELNIGLLHGQLPTIEKERIMQEFRQGIIHILVSTTVIEVGVNIPNATIMVIQNAERFGLAQLHQLRGRVGRGSSQSYCILVADPKTPEGKARMKIMTETNDGFKIAEQDLLLRGPGDFFGTKQHGLPELKVADLVQDILLIEKTKILADEIIKEGLNSPQYKNLVKELKAKIKNNLNIS